MEYTAEEDGYGTQTQRFEGLLEFGGQSLLLPLPFTKVCRGGSYTAPAQCTACT